MLYLKTGSKESNHQFLYFCVVFAQLVPITKEQSQKPDQSKKKIKNSQLF